jgi:hypothetical protein
VACSVQPVIVGTNNLLTGFLYMVVFDIHVWIKSHTFDHQRGLHLCFFMIAKLLDEA